MQPERQHQVPILLAGHAHREVVVDAFFQVVVDREAVRRCGGVREAAREFGITKEGLYGWINKLDGDTLQSFDVRFDGFEDVEPASAGAA